MGSLDSYCNFLCMVFVLTWPRMPEVQAETCCINVLLNELNLRCVIKNRCNMHATRVCHIVFVGNERHVKENFF